MYYLDSIKKKETKKNVPFFFFFFSIIFNLYLFILCLYILHSHMFPLRPSCWRSVLRCLVLNNMHPCYRKPQYNLVSEVHRHNAIRTKTGGLCVPWREGINRATRTSSGFTEYCLRLTQAFLFHLNLNLTHSNNALR